MALPRPLSDHTLIVCAARLGSAKSTYFKLDRSWLRDRTLKNEILEWWGSCLTFGAASEQLCTKLKDLRHHLFAFRQQIRSEQTRSRDDALARVEALDDIEDSRPYCHRKLKSGRHAETRWQKWISGSNWAGVSDLGRCG